MSDLPVIYSYLYLLLLSILHGKLIGFIGKYSGYICYNERKDVEEYKRQKLLYKKLYDKKYPKPELVKKALHRKRLIFVIKISLHWFLVDIMRIMYGNVTTLHFPWSYYGINEYSILGLLFSISTRLLSSRYTRADTFRSKCDEKNAFWLFMKYHVTKNVLIGFLISNVAVFIALMFYDIFSTMFSLDKYSVKECVLTEILAFCLLLYLINNEELFRVPEEYKDEKEQ